MESENNLSSFQKRVDDFIRNHGDYWPPLSMLSALVEEIGELARELNKLEGYKPKKSSKIQLKTLGEEIGDLFFSLICMANYFKINLSEELEEVIKKYKKRDSKRFI